MRLFFDNNLSPVLADTIGAYAGSQGHTAHHIMSLPCGRHAADREWIAMLEKEKDWVAFTGDLRISRNKAEREAYRRAGLLGFALAPALCKRPLNEVAAALLLRWQDIDGLMRLVATGLYEIPIRKDRSGFRALL